MRKIRKMGMKKPLTLAEKNKRLIKLRYVILHLLHRGAHGFEQKFIQAAGVPVFTEHGIPQVVEALDDYAVLGGGEVYLEFPFFIGPSSFVISLYVEGLLHRKCAKSNLSFQGGSVFSIMLTQYIFDYAGFGNQICMPNAKC